MSECDAAKTKPTGTEADLKQSKAMCTYFKDSLGCYPPCYCAAMKETIDSSIKLMETTYDCDDWLGRGMKCGSAAGLRASAFSVFVAAAVALVAAH